MVPRLEASWVKLPVDPMHQASRHGFVRCKLRLRAGMVAVWRHPMSLKKSKWTGWWAIMYGEM
jgi:hypothetical protein